MNEINKLYASICVKLFLIACFCSLLFITTDRSFLDNVEQEQTTAQREEEDSLDQDFIDSSIGLTVQESKESILKNSDIYQSYLKAKDSNSDTVGWIKIEGTLVDYPIMHSETQDFYLDHASDKSYAKNGSIYMDSAQSDWGYINMIHGHNLKSGKMFGQLVKYKEEDFARQHSYIEVVKDGKICVYKVFSVFVADGSKETFNLQFEDFAQYKTYFAELKNRSKFDFVDSVKSDDIIILNTCSYEFSNAHTIVCAYLTEG